MSGTLKMTPAPRLRLAVVAALGAPRDQLISALVTVPLKVEPLADPRRVVDVVKGTRPDAVLIDPTCLGMDALDTLRALLALPQRPYVLVVVPRVTRSLETMMEAGVDDFVRSPLDGQEVWLRLRTVRPQPAAEAQAPCRAPALDAVHAGLVADLSDLMGETLKLTPETGPALASAVGAAVTLAHLEGAAELELTVSMERAHAAAVAARLLGAEPDDETLSAFVTELANVSAGALKRATLDEGTALTIGLPVYFTGAHRVAPDPRVRHRETFDLRSSAGVVRCAVATKRTAVLALPLHALREGLVLAREVRASNGMLLLTAGMRLTSSTIDRLQRSLEKAVQIEVVDVH